MKLKHCLSVIGMLLAASCMQDRIADSPSAQLLQESYEDIRIPEDNSLLYAMVPGLYDNLHTKSSDVEMISLESLIDRERASEEDFEEYHIVQIPFKDQENEMSVFLSDSVQQLLSMDNLSIVKKFLVLVENRQTSESMSIVTTFIPTQECLKEYGEQSFSYMDKSTYEGIVINSNLDGSFRSVYIYGDHPIIDGRIYEVGTENSTGYRYYLTLSKPCGSKGGKIVGSICIGEETKWL